MLEEPASGQTARFSWIQTAIMPEQAVQAEEGRRVEVPGAQPKRRRRRSHQEIPFDEHPGSVVETEAAHAESTCFLCGTKHKWWTLMEVPAPGASGHRSSNQVPWCIRARARSDGDTNIFKAIDFHNKLCKGQGANFIQWARGGASAWFKVTEIRADSGQWYAFLACRLPEELDDEIQKSPVRGIGHAANWRLKIS